MVGGRKGPGIKPDLSKFYNADGSGIAHSSKRLPPSVMV
jgi:hypothetical protein